MGKSDANESIESTLSNCRVQLALSTKKDGMILEINILLVFERTIKVLQYLMFRILFRKISMFRRNAPINAKRFIQDRDTSICLWVIEDIIVMLFNSVYKLPSCEPGSKNRFAHRLCRIMLHES